MVTKLVMAWYYAPYNGKKPATRIVNGHRVVVVTPEPEQLEHQLTFFGADRVQRVRVGNSEEERTQALARLSKRIGGSIVVAPPQADMNEVVRVLENELPWVH